MPGSRRREKKRALNEGGRQQTTEKGREQTSTKTLAPPRSFSASSAAIRSATDQARHKLPSRTTANHQPVPIS
ncbi:hypothetical protein HAX54_005316, partial [Datura stramonium]|nr:hypothetical protein [Datura stramonium]